MNYTKLKLNDQEIGLKFGMYSDRYLSTRITSPFFFNGEDITEIGIAHVIYAGYLNNCAVKDEEAKITFENVVDFVESSLKDTSKLEALTSVIKLWSDAQIAKEGGEEAKKKTTKKLKS